MLCFDLGVCVGACMCVCACVVFDFFVCVCVSHSASCVYVSVWQTGTSAIELVTPDTLQLTSLPLDVAVPSLNHRAQNVCMCWLCDV